MCNSVFLRAILRGDTSGLKDTAKHGFLDLGLWHILSNDSCFCFRESQKETFNIKYVKYTSKVSSKTFFSFSMFQKLSIYCQMLGIRDCLIGGKKKKKLEINRINCEYIPKFHFGFVVGVEGGVG